MRIFNQSSASKNAPNNNNRLKKTGLSRLHTAIMPEPLEARRMMSATLATVAALHGSNGAYPSGVINVGNDYYGTTTGNGTNNHGTIFDYNSATRDLTTLATFNGANGAEPAAGLIDVNGSLYGTTKFGGTANDGTIFQYNLASKTLSTLATFHGSNGSEPAASLIDVGGNLFGTTTEGGAASDGTVFEYDTTTNREAVIANFHGTNGATPTAELLDVNGNLYGTTSFGGAAGQGTVFEYNATTKLETVLASFTGSNGSGPEAGLVNISNILYGTTAGGGTAGDGTVFSLRLSNNSLDSLASFNATDGSTPEATLLNFDNNLFGTTSLGGASGQGTVFELSLESQGIGTVATLHGSNGAFAKSALIEVGGNLFGSTSEGGFANEGTVFEFSADPITQKYLSLGGPAGLLGASTSSEISLSPGSYEKFARGVIFYSAATGAHEVNAATAAEFLSLSSESGAFGNNVQTLVGFPTSDESGELVTLDGGTVTDLQNGIICDSAKTGAHVLYGAILAKYNTIDGPVVLGMPTNDEATAPDGVGRYVHFAAPLANEIGAIDWTPTNGAYIVKGNIAVEFASAGWEKIGEATTDETDIVSGTYTGEYNYFATEKKTTVSGKTVDVVNKLSAVNWTKQHGGSVTAGPSYTDITQGNAGTCWIDASIAAMAISGQNPWGLITYEGNNYYNVSLHNYNNPSERATGGFHNETESVFFNGTTYGSDLAWNSAIPSQSWALILQRAVIQAVHDWAPGQTIQNPHSGGAGDAQAILTGKAYNDNLATSGNAAQQAVESLLSKGESVVLNTNPSGTTTLIADHDYAVISANSSGVILYNPWGANAGGTNPFKVSWSVIAHDGEDFSAV